LGKLTAESCLRVDCVDLDSNRIRSSSGSRDFIASQGTCFESPAFGRLELPYEFEQHEYEQIITDSIEPIAPALGWQRHSNLTDSAAK